MSSIPRSDYLRHVRRAKNGGNYFVYFRHYIKLFTHKSRRTTCMFLQDVMNISDSPGVKKQMFDGEEHFQGTVNFLRDSASEWTEKEQETHLAILVDKGFVKLRRVGMPSVRWICVDFAAIEYALDAVLGDGNPQLPPHGGDCPQLPPHGDHLLPPHGGLEWSPKRGVKKKTLTESSHKGKNTHCRPAGQGDRECGSNGKHKPPLRARGFGLTNGNCVGEEGQRASFASDCAAKLGEIVSSKARIQWNPTRGKKYDPSKWGTCFRELIKHLGDDQAAQSRVWWSLEQYDEWFEDQFCPRKFSGPEFCEVGFFLKLEAWLKRRQENSGATPSQPKLVKVDIGNGRHVLRPSANGNGRHHQ